MQLPPITPTEAPTQARPFARSIHAPRTQANYVTFRLFHGEEPATLSLRDQVVVRIAERIIEQRWKPGQRISEQAVAEEFSVSKAPVSDALMLLEYAGLVVSEARRSAHVAPMSAADFREAQEYGEALTSVIYPRFVERHTAADRRIMLEYVEYLRELVDDDDRAFQFVEIADRFILYMGVHSGNRRVARAMWPLSLQLLRYFTTNIRSRSQRERVLQWFEDSLPYLDARDAKGLMAMAARSREETLAQVREALQENA